MASLRLFSQGLHARQRVSCAITVISIKFVSLL